MKIIKGIFAAPRRVLLYGPHGVGKGTWASHAPSPIFIDIEGGLDNIDCEKTERLGTLDQISEALTYILNEEHDYKTVVIDTLDWLEQIIFAHIAREAKVKSVADIGYGKGHTRATPIWQWIISQLEQIRLRRKMGVILLAHSKVERYEAPDADSYDRYSVDLHKSTGPMLQEWCDEVLFANFRVYTKKQDEGFNRQRAMAVGGQERFIRTSDTAYAIAKNRAGLPEELPMQWSAYQDAVAAFYDRNNAKPKEAIEDAGNISGVVSNGSSKGSAAYAELEQESKDVF